MNDDRGPTDWPDDRLADAFHARADAHLTPSDLSAATVDRIRRVPTGTLRRLRFARLGGLVAAAAVVAVIGIALVARPLTDRAADEGSTFGLPVLSVSEAIAIRDGGVDDREMAIHGFYATVGAMRCPPTPIRTDLNNPTRLLCEAAFTWLMEKPESVVSRTATGMSARPPQGPALKPGLALVDATAIVGKPDVPTPVVFIGHFEDRRADFCQADVRSQCAYTFIVDRIDRGLLQTVTFSDQAAAGQTDAAIDAVMKRVDPSLRIISRRVVGVENLRLIEPVYQPTPGDTPSYVSNAAWLVTALPPVDANGRAVARTFVIFDGTDFISEITRSGIVEVTPSAAASPGPTSILAVTTSPTATAAPSISTVIGPPMTVGEAIDHRDSHLGDKEILVRGFGWGPPGVIACTPLLIAPPALDQCPDGFSWIGEGKPVGSAPEFLQPDGPAFNLLVRQWTYLGSNLSYQPREILALGHFDDPQAEQCAPELVKRCRRNFLVDAILDPTRGWPADNTSSPSLTCADGLPIPDCAAAASAVLESLTGNEGIPTNIEIGSGVWCPTPGLLFENTTCPAGGMPPTEGGQWIGHALVTFRDSPAQAYLNIARSGTVVRAKSIALATPPASPS